MPTIQEVPLSTRIWSWTQPFSGPVWAVLVSFMVVTGFSMYLFEGRDNAADFDRNHGYRDIPNQLAGGFFTAVTTFTTQNAEGYSPVTVAGRVYQVSLSLSTILVFACCAHTPRRRSSPSCAILWRRLEATHRLFASEATPALTTRSDPRRVSPFPPQTLRTWRRSSPQRRRRCSSSAPWTTSPRTRSPPASSTCQRTSSSWETTVRTTDSIRLRPDCRRDTAPRVTASRAGLSLRLQLAVSTASLGVLLLPDVPYFLRPLLCSLPLLPRRAPSSP